jgi:hypothetical protein
MAKARKPTKRQQELIDEQRVRHAYHRVGANVEVPISSLAGIKAAGLAAVAAGADDAGLDAAVKKAIDEARAPA